MQLARQSEMLLNNDSAMAVEVAAEEAAKRLGYKDGLRDSQQQAKW